MQIDQVSWIIVADQQRVKILEERRRGGPLHEMAIAGVVDGRDDDGERHRGVDALAETRRRMHRLGALLEAAAQARRFDKLILIAPPRALGLLRAELGALQDHVAAVDHHDCVDEGPQDVRRRLHDIRLETAS